MKSRIAVPRLKRFSPVRWSAIRDAFAEAPELIMMQGWQERASVGFLAAKVRLGWKNDALNVYARIPDRNIFSKAVKNNQELYQFGDVFEIFLRDTARKPYYELHVSPNLLHLQLEFPSTEIFQKKNWKLESFKVRKKIFRYKVRVDRKAGEWEVYAQVPATTVSGKKVSLAGRVWLASFSRYDYTKGKKDPVISSTSNHRVANFHRQQEWRPLQFEG